MSEKHLLLVESYYAAMNKRELESMEKMLHPDVLFTGPLAEVQGKEHVLEAIKKFTEVFNRFTIRRKFYDDKQVMLAMDTEFPEPIGSFPTASLVTIDDGLIARIELFFDSKLVESKKDEIFSN